MNRELKLAVVFAALTLLWNLYGFAGNFFEHYWGGSERPVVLISYLVNALLLAALAAVGVKQLSAARALAIAGLAMAVWSLAGVSVEVGMALGKLARGTDAPRLNLPEPPPLVGALVPMITGALAGVLAWRANRR